MSVGPFMVAKSRNEGTVACWAVGDSHNVAGSDNELGLFGCLQVGLEALEVSPRWVGKLAMNEAQFYVPYDSFGGQLTHHSVSGITTEQLLNGGTGTLGTLAADLETYRPDVSFLSLGANDSSGDINDYRRVLETFSAYQKFHKLVWFMPPDGNTTSNSFYGADSTKVTCRAAIWNAVRQFRGSLQVILVNAASALGSVVRYPSSAVGTDNTNANAIYRDSVHLKAEGYAIWAASGLAKAFNMRKQDVLRLMCQTQPFAPVDWSYPATDGNITAGAAATIMVAGGARKNAMTNIEVYNPHAATTAVVTIGKRRLLQNGSTDTDTAFQVYKLAAGTRDGWSHNMESAPVAWFNEGWYISCTGADVNVTCRGKQVLHTES